MVIWKGEAAWSAFGFFGQGGSGKTTLSFDFSLRLLRDGFLDLKVFDDRLLLDTNTVRRDGESTWGRPDGLGKRTEFEREANSRNMQLDDFLPDVGEEYVLGDVTIWFLTPTDRPELHRKPLGLSEFLEWLVDKDPFHDLKKPTADDLSPSFRQNWRYELVWVPNLVTILEELRRQPTRKLASASFEKN
jgi:hypothetical protein